MIRIEPLPQIVFDVKEQVKEYSEKKKDHLTNYILEYLDYTGLDITDVELFEETVENGIRIYLRPMRHEIY